MTKIMIGDCIEQLRLVPDRIVHCCVTSPPYFGLRDYGHAGQIGHEETPDAYVAKLVEVFREVRRVLRDDGTLWLNLGDSYSAGGNGGGNKNDTNKGSLTVGPKKTVGFQPKQLLGIPWRVAFALQDDGWILRQDIIWHKPNPMPESVRDRCTKSHEYIFLFAKSQRYFFDQEAIKVPIKDTSAARLIQDVENQKGSDRVPGKTNGRMKAVRFGGNKLCPDTRLQSGKEWKPSMAGGGTSYAKGHSGYFDKEGNPLCGVMANKKSVWTVTTKPYKGAHFAVFPKDLIEPCILAGTSEFGVCSKCLSQRVRETSRSSAPTRPGTNSTKSRDPERHVATVVTTDSTASCGCNAATIPAVVLDPFAGSGTVAEVAKDHGRHSIMIELNPEYRPLIEQRLAKEKKK